jgi:uncharacterized protein
MGEEFGLHILLIQETNKEIPIYVHDRKPAYQAMFPIYSKIILPANTTNRIMANIAYFQIPADNVDRAKKFYQSLLGWKIEPDTTLQDKSLQWENIITGEPEEGTMHMGGLYKRMGPSPIMNFVKVVDIDTILARVEKLGGKIIMPKSDIPSVGLVAVIQDTEENIIGLWTPGSG